MQIVDSDYKKYTGLHVKMDSSECVDIIFKKCILFLLLGMCATFAMSSMLSCDFEQTDLCGWKQSSDDDFDWLRHTGQTPSGDTGPSSDHTFQQSNKGHYMFIETSSPRKPGDAAELWSPLYLPDQSDQCFELYYHMMGKDDDKAVGSLDILVKPESQPLDTVSATFHEEGNKGDEWMRAEVMVPPLDEKFQLIVVATRLESYASDIAVDDVRLYNCSEVTTVDSLMTDTTTSMITTTATLPATTATITIKRRPTTSPQPTLTTARPTRRSTTTLQTTTQARTTVKPTTTSRTTPQTTTGSESTTWRPSTSIRTPTSTPITKRTRPTVAPTRRPRPTTTTTTSATTRTVTRRTRRPWRTTTTTSARTTQPTPQMTMPQKTTKKPKWTRKPRWTRRPKTSKTTTATTPITSSTTSRVGERVSVTTIAMNNTVKSTEQQLGNMTTPNKELQQTTTDNSMYNSSTGSMNNSDIYYQTNERPDKKSKTPRPATPFWPLAVGIGGGVVFVIIVIAILATVWAKKKKRQAVDPFYDEMEPITKAVSKTSLNLDLVNDYKIIDDE